MKLKKLQIGGYVPTGDPRYATSPEIRKAQQEMINKAKNSGLLEIIPLYGTYKSAERFIKKPNIGTGLETLMSGLTDVASGGLIGAAAKGLKYSNKAKKAQSLRRTLNQREKKVITSIMESAPEKRAALIKKQQNASNSLSLMERTPKIDKEILKRQKDINWLKEASPEEILSNTLRDTKSSFADRRSKLYLKHDMPNSIKAENAFKTAKQYGTLVIPGTVGKEAIRVLNTKTTVFDSEPKLQDRLLSF